MRTAIHCRWGARTCALVLGLVALFTCNSAFAQGGTSTTDSCSGTFSNTTFAKDLVVPDFATCTLLRFNVVGNDILVGTGSTLNVCPDNNIGGSIRADQATSVLVTDQTGFPECGSIKSRGILIGVDVRVKDSGMVRLIGNPSGGVAVIQRDVEIKNVQSVEIRDFNNMSRIGRDVEVRNAATLTIKNNVIGRDLEIGGTIGTCTEQNNTVARKHDTCP